MSWGTIFRGGALAASPELHVSALDWAVLAWCGAGGYLLGRHLPIPGGSMVAAMLLSTTVHAAGITVAGPPLWLVAAVQIVIGSIAGSRFKGADRRDLSTTVVYG